VSGASDDKPSLAGARAKLGRATFHLQELATDWQEVVDGHDYTFVHEVHASGLNHRYRAAAVPELDARWALVLGDCVHNLRAALDHLAHDLVRADGGTPGERTQFPVQHTAGPAFVWGGVSDEARGLINAVQPFTDSDDGKRLAVIDRLDNAERQGHLELTVGARGVTVPVRGEDTRPAPRIIKVWTSDQPIASGKTVHGYTYETPHFLEDPNVRVVPHLTIEDSLAEACFGRLDARELLGDVLVRWVRDSLLPRFESCFD
jgi:hypothetical protein